jgi:hypothetical protein
MKATWPKGGYPINTIHIVPENFGRNLIQLGYSELVQEIKTADKDDIETADRTVGETAESPANKKRGR